MHAFLTAFSTNNYSVPNVKDFYWWSIIIYLISLSVRCALPMLFCLSLLLWVPLALASYSLIMSEERKSNHIVRYIFRLDF